MPTDPDKYPTDSNRRRFVKGLLGGASLVGAGTTAAVSTDALTTFRGTGGGTISYLGLEAVDGPAPRALPQVPVELDDDGYLRGIWPEEVDEDAEAAEMQLGGQTYSSAWFQYCGVQTSPAIRPDADRDDYLRYAAGDTYDWQSDAVDPGSKVHVDDFDDYEDWGNGVGSRRLGKPAAVTWRSRDLEPADALPVQVIRSPVVEENARESEWLAASTDAGFVAHLNKCTHFCCVPGFKHTQQAETQHPNGGDLIYCQCHQSFYDPFSVVKRTYTALPRPE